MIVIHARHPPRNGSGIFSSIFKAIASKAAKSGAKNAIKKVLASKVTHKLATIVAKGAAKGTAKLVKRKIADLKRPRETERGQGLLPKKKIKIDISHLVNGSGIVLD